MCTPEETEFMNPASAQMAGTVGDDVMTVHRLTDGKPACGAVGKVDEWQRAVTCPDCLSLT